VAFAVWRMTFVKSSSIYMKGLAFIMVPLYYVSMVELIRWCWILSIPPEGVPPDTSDLYLLGVDTLLSTQLFFGLPNKIGLTLFTGGIDTALTGWALFYLRLLLDISLIAALAKALTNAIFAAQVYRQTGLKGGLGKTDVKALAAIQEIGLKRDPQEIGKLEKSVKDVGTVLSKVVVAAWGAVFAWFFGGAIKRAIARDVADLIERAARPEIADNPLARRTLYERALRKAPHQHDLLLLASRTDLDVAARRVYL